jgi:hypothetical protein
MVTTFQLYRTPISWVILITADFQKEGGVVCILLLYIFPEIVASLLHMPCDSGIITEIPVAHCFSNCCIRLHVPYWLVNSFLMFSPFLSLTKASPNSAPCSRPVQAAVFALLTSFVFQRLCWGNRRCGEKFISSNPSHQNCTTQSMRYGLIIFIATTTDLLYLNWGLCVIDTEGLMYLSFTLHK